jgi:MFS family permease
MKSLTTEVPTGRAAEKDDSGRMTRKDIRTLALSSLGSALEYYDFTVFVFFAAVIGQVFFPPETPEWLRQAQAFAIFAVGFLVRPVGGVVIAHFGDKYGRKKLFMLTIFLMAVPTLLIGLLPTYAVAGIWAPILLLAMRVLQGLAVAGEVPGSAVFVTEHVPGRRVGVACASLFGALYLGLFLGSLAGAVTSAYLDKEALHSYGWRLAFIVGGLFGLVSVYLRRFLDETPLFEQLRETKQLAKTVPIKEVIKNHLAACFLVVGLAFLLSEVITVLFQFMPTFLQTHYKVPKATVFQANTVAIVVLAVMNPAWGWLGDRIGLGRALALGALCTAVVTTWFFSQLGTIAAGERSLLTAWTIVAIPAGFIGLIPGLAAVVFPTAVRFTGFAFPYNLGAALFAGLTPLAVTYVVQAFGPGAPVYLVAAACAVGVGLGLWAQRFKVYTNR